MIPIEISMISQDITTAMVMVMETMIIQLTIDKV